MLTKEIIKFYWISAVIVCISFFIYTLNFDATKLVEKFSTFIYRELPLKVLLGLQGTVYLYFLWQLKHKKISTEIKLRVAVATWVIILFLNLKFFIVTHNSITNTEIFIFSSFSILIIGLSYPYEKYFNGNIEPEELTKLENNSPELVSISAIRFYWFIFFVLHFLFFLDGDFKLNLDKVDNDINSLHLIYYAFIIFLPISAVLLNYQVVRNKSFTDRIRSRVATCCIFGLIPIIKMTILVGVALLDLNFRFYFLYDLYLILIFLFIFPRKEDFGPSGPVQTRGGEIRVRFLDDIDY